jgi:hypothetical protein
MSRDIEMFEELNGRQHQINIICMVLTCRRRPVAIEVQSMLQVTASKQQQPPGLQETGALAQDAHKLLQRLFKIIHNGDRARSCTIIVRVIESGIREFFFLEYSMV